MMVVAGWDVLLQAVLALVASVAVGSSGFVLIRAGWLRHGEQGQREFLLGVAAVVLAFSELVAGVLILFGYGANDAHALVDLRVLVVFVNAASRSVFIIIGVYLVWNGWRVMERRHREHVSGSS